MMRKNNGGAMRALMWIDRDEPADAEARRITDSECFGGKGLQAIPALAIIRMI